MSCSVHDCLALESSGVPAVFVASSVFVDAAEIQSRALGFPSVARVFVPHPIQLLDTDGIRALADHAYPAIRARLLAP